MRVSLKTKSRTVLVPKLLNNSSTQVNGEKATGMVQASASMLMELNIRESM